jgi:pSer/pThr/pTyr-binding forkhead associated (FHA) protein
MMIRLEYRGTIVREVAEREVKDEITIGRSRHCTWVLPKEDEVASSRHASLVSKGGSVWVRDLESRNGLYCQGQKITEKKLVPGDRITLGDCLLAVEVDPEAGGERRPSTLSVLSGPGKGRKYVLTPPRFSIGSDPGAALVLLDQLVSKKHAEITVKNDASCWIRDLGSKNGTTVNSLPLRGDQERLLKDGDRIQISHLDLLFQDGAIKHVNYQVGLRVLVLVATALLAFGAYSAYQNLRPGARRFLDDARRQAAAGHFDQARQSVTQAAGARNAERHAIERADLARLVNAWQTTSQLWEKTRGELQAGDWVAAARDLGSLLAGGKDAWGWNPEAAGWRQAAVAAKTMVDALARAQQTLGREESTLADYQRARAAVAECLARVASPAAPEYLARLTGEVRQAQVRLDQMLGENRRLDEALARLGGLEPPFPEILRSLRDMRAGCGPLVAQRLDAVTPVAQALADGYAGIRQVAQLDREMKFAEAASVTVTLPPPALCAVDAMLSRCRGNQEKLHALIRRTGSQVGFLMGTGDAAVNRPAAWEEAINFFADAERVERILSCDVLSGPVPRRSRSEPVGDYDVAVGIEEFYEFLGNLPEPAAGPAADNGFTPKLRRLRDLGGRSERLLAYLKEPDCQWILTGAMVDTRDRLVRALGIRDAIVKSFVDQARGRQGRAALIAGGIAAYLAPAAPGPEGAAQTMAEWTAARFKQYRATILKLNHAFDGAAPEEQIQLRGEILDAGLPGDPVVRRMWAMRESANRASSAPAAP